MLQSRHTVQVGPMNVGGLWGRRLRDSVSRWSLQVNEDTLLDCFRHRPGKQSFIGEHAGKYIDGAILDNFIVDDPKLWEKIDRVIQGLMACQEEDGYLGTYTPDMRWIGRATEREENNAWDVWVAKYCLLALLRYDQLHNSPAACDCARKIIRQLIAVFGERRAYNLNASDCHAGLASGSVLEALALWYQRLGEEEILSFARYIVTWYWTDQAPGTPHLLSRMTQLPYGLKTTGRGKAYEMMSCFVGLVEYARVTDDEGLLKKVVEARDNIAAYYREVNGCMSEREWFPNAENISEHSELENCVAFTWIQLNLRLFELTGDMRCIDYAEETAYNHIMQSVCPDGSTWIYYTLLTGPKDFSYWSQLPGSAHYHEMMRLLGAALGDEEISDPAGSAPEAPLTCCHTNGQRALGLVPQYIYTQSGDEVFINFLMDSSKTLLIGGVPVTLTLQTDFPRSSEARLTVKTQRPVKIHFRIPYWTDCAEISGKRCAPGQYETLEISGDTVMEIRIHQPIRLLTPGFVNRGKFAVAYGPVLYAVDSCPEGWDFDDIALLLSAEKPLSALEPFEENGWTAFRAGACRIPHHIGQLTWENIPQSLPQAQVVLRPFLFAGLGKNLDYAQQIEHNALQYDVSELLTEFRILFPAFFNDHEFK